MNARKVVFVIDGWFMRKRIMSLKAFEYNGPNIRKYCMSHLKSNDYLYRIFYYDTPPLDARGHNPVSKKHIAFNKEPVYKAQSKLLESIKTTPHFALRLGETVWRNNGWMLTPDKLKQLLNKKITVDDLEDSDVKPIIEQKLVDMKIGLDIANMATKGVADVLIIITGDSDITPALKFARREGMQVGIDPLRNPIRPSLAEHVDFISTKIKKP